MNKDATKTGTFGSAGIYFACALALLASNALLAWKVWDLQSLLKASPPGADPAAVLRLLDTPLHDDDGKTWTLGSETDGPVVLFAFAADDCGPCLNELSNLNRAESQGASAFSLMSFANSDEARQTRENFDVRYPILLDEDGKILNSLQLPKTPWKIVIDARRRRILYEDYPSVTQTERDAFLTRLSIIH